MPRRFLTGPVSVAFADQSLFALRAADRCRVFGPYTGLDLSSSGADTWESLGSRLPDSWRPEFLVLHLAHTPIPPGLWQAPVPLIGLAPDAHRHLQAYRRLLPHCDLVFAAGPAAAVLRRDGFDQVLPAQLCGLERAYLETPLVPTERDIDLLFVGNFQAALQRERLTWLGRLGRLSDRWNVVLATDVSGAGYRALLRRARIVFNRSTHGECNRRAFEATACGALLFQEHDNRDTAAYFTDRQTCVTYDRDNLEALLEHYLTHEDERRVLAEAGRVQSLRCSSAALWEPLQEAIEQHWSALPERVRFRPRLERNAALQTRTEVVATSAGHDPALVEELDAALRQTPDDAHLLNARGVAGAAAARSDGRPRAPDAATAARWFRRALAADSTNLAFALNLLEALVGIEQLDVAAAGARQALLLLEGSTVTPDWDVPHFPPAFDLFRAEWERAAWDHAGDRGREVEAKRALLRWRLHSLFADCTGDLSHHLEAVRARPDLPSRQAALGRALLRANRAAEAELPLRGAVAANPFDRAAARDLFQALRAAGALRAAAALAHERRLLSRAAPQLLPPERWFVDEGPTGDELVSIIILCCNELDYTRRCLHSVWQHTHQPYELVVVDNGSTDGTSAFLAEARTRPGPVRLEIVHNDRNRGYPAGCNQGLAAARGRYLVFLNNDTVVTEGWLAGLLAWALRGWPEVGLVGPVTNCAAPPQQIAVDYQDADGLHAFATRRHQDYAGQALPCARLSGFCLLACRAVLAQVGGFDDGFGLGFFDDDDLGLRVRRAGYQLLIAQDVFVHHFGSRTFTHLGIDCLQQLRKNFERFRAKWGAEVAAPYRLPGGNHPALVPSAAPTPQRVSLCLIVRDEESNLPACLESVADLVQEIVVVDTGSTDTTRAIAARFGAKVVNFPWVDSFSAARNESLHQATGDWIFWLDADDRLDADNRGKLRALFAKLQPDNAAYAMKCRCLPDTRTGAETVVDHIRLFRNEPTLRWEFRVHEQILPALRRSHADIRWADVVIHHTGYQDPTVRHRKLERDLALLQREHAERGEHPFILFNLGAVYHELGRHGEAVLLLRRSLARSRPSDSIVRKLYALLVACHRAGEQFADALAVCQEGRQLYPDDAELLFAEAGLRRQKRDLEGAAACLVRLLEATPEPHFASVDAGLRGYRARQLLGDIYQEQGRWLEAERHWQAAVAERPDCQAVWQSLGQLYLTQRRWPELEETARRLEAWPSGQVAAAVLCARAALARREFAAAQRHLAPVIEAHAQALGPRVILSHVLLQEGADLVAAERALRAILALEPHHPEAGHNLQVLLRQRAGGRQTGIPTVTAPVNPGHSPHRVPAPLVHRSHSACALRVAVITIAHNEEDFITPLLEHYFALGAKSVFLLNNDCTDRTVERARRFPGVVIQALDSNGQLDDRLRRDTLERQRAACAGQYDYVFLVDSDEFIVPKTGTLQETLARHQDQAVLGTEGYDVIQRPDEPPYDPSLPLFAQRRWGVPNAAYNKPVVLRPECPGRLGIGQHLLEGSTPYPPSCPFFLLHFAAFDESIFLKRRLQMVARQGEHNIRRRYGREYTKITVADLRRRWDQLQQHPQQRLLPTLA